MVSCGVVRVVCGVLRGGGESGVCGILRGGGESAVWCLAGWW